jgi:hypothetical protein
MPDGISEPLHLSGIYRQHKGVIGTYCSPPWHTPYSREFSKGKERNCYAYFYLVGGGSFNQCVRKVCDMEEGEKKPGAGAISGSPQKQIVYAVLAIAIVILAVVLIAKFDYNTDLLNPAGSQMSLVQRQPVAMKQQPHLGITVATTFAEANSRPSMNQTHCTTNQTACNGLCVDLQTDPKNCGSCGEGCPVYPHADSCSDGKCGFTCKVDYADCNQNNADGCEVCIRNNHDNCGSCGHSCNGVTCIDGVCRSGSPGVDNSGVLPYGTGILVE